MASRTAAIALDGTSEHGLWRVILASSVGTMIEWYDFYIFGSLAAVLSLKFYPPGNDTFAYIAYLATFAVGFLVRPFGALFFVLHQLGITREDGVLGTSLDRHIGHGQASFNRQSRNGLAVIFERLVQGAIVADLVDQKKYQILP